MKLTFHGGAQSVTGANYLLESGNTRILIDCGMQQGGRYAERQNFENFGYDPKTIDAVFITHAHIDHTGRLPKLVKDGFGKVVYSTPATRDFARVLLLDSEAVMAKEAEFEGLEKLYSVEDVEDLMKLWVGVEYHHKTKVGPFSVEFYNAGHILGSSIVIVEAEGKKIAFSGDLGNYPAPIIKSTEFLDDLNIDYCLVESTYGDRIHEDNTRRKDKLEDAIEDSIKQGGTLMIPSFAMERTQELLFELNDLVENGRVPRVPIFIDSPLAINLTAVYKSYPSYYNKETWDLIRSGDSIFNFPGLKMTLSKEESRGINSVPAPKIVIAGSGMSNGGRILYHEKLYLSDPKNSILFVGYQANGTLGRKILNGDKFVRIFGDEVAVRCSVRAIGGYSAHADQPRLIHWVSAMRNTLKKVFVIQGEENSSNVLALKLRDELAIDAEVPKHLDVYEL